MKNNKKNKLFKYIFCFLLISFIVIYFSEFTGYYNYQNYQKTVLTKQQIKKFEEDIKNGNEVDIKEYLAVEKKKYNNTLSVFASKLSENISKLVYKGVDYTFKYISKLVEE